MPVKMKKKTFSKQQHLKKWINKVSNTTKNITSLSNVLFAAAMQMKKYFIHLREAFVFPVWFSFIQMISFAFFYRRCCCFFSFCTFFVCSICERIVRKYRLWLNLNNAEWPPNVSFAVDLPKPTIDRCVISIAHVISSSYINAHSKIACTNKSAQVLIDYHVCSSRRWFFVAIRNDYVRRPLYLRSCLYVFICASVYVPKIRLAPKHCTAVYLCI